MCCGDTPRLKVLHQQVSQYQQSYKSASNVLAVGSLSARIPNTSDNPTTQHSTALVAPSPSEPSSSVHVPLQKNTTPVTINNVLMFACAYHCTN